MSCSLDKYKVAYEKLVKDVQKLHPDLSEEKQQIIIGRSWGRALVEKKLMSEAEARMFDYIMAKSHNGKILMMPNGSSKKQLFETPLRIEKKAQNVTVYLLNGQQFTFANGSTVSKLTGNRNYMTSPIMERIEENSAYIKYGSEVDSSREEWVFNEETGQAEKKSLKDKLDGYETIAEGDLINNPEDVKKFIDTLVDMDKEEVTAEEVEFLKEVADIIADPIEKYGREISVKVKKTAMGNDGFIVFNGEQKGIYLDINDKKSRLGNEMSAAQRYVHELVHGVTHFAYKYGGARLTGTISRLKKLHNKTMEEVTWEDLMPDVSVDYEAEKHQAKARWKYINENMEEFIAYAMTHKKLRDKMMKIDAGRIHKDMKGMSLWGKLKEMVSRMISAAFEKARKEPADMKADELMMKLTKDLMSANDLAVKQYNNKILNSTAEAFEVAEDWWIESSDKVLKWVKERSDIDKSTIPGKDQPLKGALWLIKNSWRLWSDTEFRPYMSTILSSMFMPRTGTVQTLMRHLSDTNDFQDKMEELGLARNHIDQIRRKIKQGLKGALEELWGRKLTKSEKKTITMGVLKTDLGSLNDKYTDEEMKKLLTDEKALLEAIKTTEKEITGDERKVRYKLAQAKSLAAFMISGKGTRTTHMNAYNIEHMVGTKYESTRKIEYNDNMATIDRLATLYSLKANDKSVKEQLKSLAEENIDAVLAYGRHMNNFNEQQYLNPTQKIKGWVKEIYNNDITSKIAPLAREEEMEALGFTVEEKLIGSSRNGGEMALYVNRDKMLTSYNVSAMGLTDTAKHQGTTLLDNSIHSNLGDAYKRNKTQIEFLEKQNGKQIEDVMNGKTDSMFTPDNLLTLRDGQGQTVGFIYGLTTDQKVNVLEMDMDPGEIMGTMQASLHDQQQTDILNNELVDALERDMDINLDPVNEFDGNEDINGEIGFDGTMYVKISEDSENVAVQEAWRVMPAKMKSRVNGMPSGLWVKEEALHDAFGFRSGSVVDLAVIKHMPGYVKHLIRMAEKMWQQIIKVAKVDIIMRVPGVLIGNIISNTMYLVQMGFNPKDVVTMQANGLNELHRYIDTSNKVARLEAKEIAKKDGLSKKEKEELNRLKATLEDGSIGDLVDAGLYQAIVEDVGLEDIKSSSNIHNWSNDKLDELGSPQWVKNGANWLYVSEKTGLFQFMQRATQYSDFVARYAMYHMGQEKTMRKFEKKNKRKMTPAEIKDMQKKLIKEITQSFINYNKPDSVFLQWMNDMGLVMFTKYALRIQKVWKDGITRHPIRFMLSVVGQDMAGIDIDDITDKNVFERGLDDLLYMPDATDLAWRTFVPVTLRTDEVL